MPTQTPTNSYNYFALATENPAAEGTAVAAQKFGAYNNLSLGAQIGYEADEGHVGGASTLLGNDRTTAHTEPSITERLRPDDAMGYYIAHFFGSTTSTRNIPSTGLSYKHEYEESATGLPTATLFQGYNFDADTAKRSAGAVCEALSFQFNLNQAPKITARYKGDFYNFGVTEPTLSYSTTPSFKASQIDVYMDAYPSGTIGTTAMDGFREATVNLTHEVTIDPNAENDFGVNDKLISTIKVDGSFVRKYTADDEDYMREWATGSFSGTTPTVDSLFKKVRFKYTGATIETIYPYQFYLDILKMEITNVERTTEGADATTFNHSFTGVVDTSTSTMVEAFLQNKVATYAYIAP